MLERNVVHLQGNAQSREGFRGGSYGEKGEQITQRPGDQYRGGYQNKRGQLELARDSNAIEVKKGRKEDRTCFIYKKQSYMAKNCWQRKGKERRVVEMLQELVKDNREQ